MARSPHRVAKLDFNASVDDVDLAFELRPRMERLAWELMPAAMERVFDSAGPADGHLRIERLDLDLGRVRPDRLEEDAIAALEAALSEALGEALHSARYAPSGSARLVAPAAALVEDFEAYLVWGRLPSARSGGGGGFDPAGALRTLIAEHPEALVAMLHGLARDRTALERLLLQAGEAGFRHLLDLLAPGDSAVILALLADTLIVHRQREVEVPPRLTEPALDRLLRLATLEFLLRDPGSQFNRRRFLAHLLQAEAAALGLDYASLLRLLEGALAAVRARTGFRSSLPAVLADLLAESAAEDSEAAAIAEAKAGNFRALLALVAGRAADRWALEDLVRRLPGPLFAELIGRLRPAGSAPILAILGELTLADARSEPALRSLTLLHLLREPGERFDRRRLLDFLLEQEATLLPALFAELADALGEDPSALDESGLVAALAEARSGDLTSLLILARDRACDPEAFLALIARIPGPLFARLVRHARPSAAAAILDCLDSLVALHRESPLLVASDSTFLDLVRATGLRLVLAAPEGRFGRRAWLRQVIAELAERAGGSAKALRRALAEAIAARTGSAGQGGALLAQVIRAEEGEAVFAWRSNSDLVLRALGGDSEAAAAALRGVAGDSASLLRLAAGLDEREREWLLVALDGRDGALLADELRQLERLHPALPLPGMDRAEFAQLLWTIAVGYRVERGRTRFDRAELGRHLAEALARFGGRRAPEFAADLRQGLARLSGADAETARTMAADYFGEEAASPDLPPADEARRAIEQYLRTGRPLAAGHGLPALAASDRAWLAATVRGLARATPGRVPILTDRLLAWLMPDELLECLSPGSGALAARWADASGAVDESGWRAAVAAVLRGEAPAFADPGGGAGRRMDRIALLSHWLDHGSAAWWAPDDALADALLADLPGLTFAELDRLFGGADPERAFARLWRAIQALGPDLQSRLFERLVPRSARAGLAAALDRLEPRHRLLALARAAADSLAGRGLDPARLAAPIAEPPPPPQAATAVPAPAQTDSARLFDWLDGAQAGAAEAEALARHFARLADSGDPELADYLARRRGQPRVRARWASLLPPEALGRLVRLLVPSGAQAWLDSAALLAAAARQSASFGSGAPDAAQVWTALLDLIAPAGAPSPDRGTAILADRLAEGDERRSELLRAHALKLAQRGGHVAVAAALRRAAPAPAAAKKGSAPRRSAKKPSSPADRVPEDSTPPEPKDPIYIGNAGLVLINPFLPRLFEKLELLTETDKGPRLVGLEAISRGVHLLQYIVDERCDRPEPMLVLNKLLCNVPPAQPIEPSIEPTNSDRKTCEDLIAAVMSHWAPLAKSSPAALRETFLQREGRLRHDADGWKLEVQRKTVDVLVDQIPWNLTTLFHRWMPEPMHILW